MPKRTRTSFALLRAAAQISVRVPPSMSSVWSVSLTRKENEGIVTRFDIQTYPLAEIQYTVNVYDPSDYENVLRATTQVQRAAESDPKIGMFANCQGSFIALGFFYYGRTEKPPEAFQPFFKLGSLLQAAVPTTNGSVKSLVDSLALMDTVLR